MTEPAPQTPPDAPVAPVVAAAAPPTVAAAPRARRFPRIPAAPLIEALALFGGIGLSCGLFVWAIGHGDQLGVHVTDNKLGLVSRRVMLQFMAGGGAISVALGWLLWAEWRTGSVDRLRRVGLRLSPLLTLGLMPLIYDWSLWQGRELLGLLMILGSCLGVERAVRVSLDAGPCVLPAATARWLDSAAVSFRSSRVAQRAPLILVLAAALAYAVFFSIFSIRNHYRFATAAFDMGIENNLVWNASRLNGPLFKTSPLGGPTAVHSGYHQTFISYLIAIPYRLWSTPQFLLVLQSAISAAAAVPLFVWIKGRLGAWLGAVVALAYLFYPPLHGGNLYDFHYQPFGPFFIFTTLLFLERGWWKRAALFVLLTLSLREDMSLMLVVVGAYLVLTRQRVTAGIVVAAVCATVFVVQKMIIMPTLLNGQAAYVHQYKDLIAPGDTGFGGVLKTVLSNPAFTLESLLKMDKTVYALHIFVPLMLLPLRRAIGWLFCAPGIFFTMLSTEYPPLVSISFQYTAYWSMFVFLAVGWAMATTTAAKRTAMAAALIVATGATTWNFGAWLRPEHAKGGFGVHHFTLTEEDHRRHRDAYTLIDQIPPDARVAATELLNPQISSRANAYALRDGAFDADYLLFELSNLRSNERTFIGELLLKDEVGVVDAKGGFWLLKRGASPARNAEIAQFFR